MSQPKRKPKEDLRRTLTPIGSQIIADSNRFSVSKDHELIAEVGWDQVQAIYAYSRYIEGVGGLRLDFVLSHDAQGNEQRVVVHEALDGWELLASELEREFPDLDKDWRKKASSDIVSALAKTGFGVTVPKFVANPIEVWQRSA